METRLMHASPEAFDAIRPYRDEEVREILDRLARNPELTLAIQRFRFPHLNFWPLQPLLNFLVRRSLHKRLAAMQSIRDVQLLVENYMQRMINTTTDGLTVTGLDQLPRNQTYLFISNHRDIAMDPALVNLALYQNQRDTARIAIGDNLLKKDYVTDLMRLNKSFIVQRSAKGVRQMLASFKLLSRYIHHSLNHENQSIWIAQREGRAKDGIDHTDPAIIKMFCMSGKEEQLDFNASLARLRLVPVALSYEYDPLDQAKARELTLKQQQGGYAKGEFEDIDSIAQGIAGYKGRVHLAFGKVLEGSFEDADAVAAAVDAQIRDLYHLFPSNYLALEALNETDRLNLSDIGAAERAAFHQRLQSCPAEYRTALLQMYANPVKNRLHLLS